MIIEFSSVLVNFLEKIISIGFDHTYYDHNMMSLQYITVRRLEIFEKARKSIECIGFLGFFVQYLTYLCVEGKKLQFDFANRTVLLSEIYFYSSKFYDFI